MSMLSDKGMATTAPRWSSSGIAALTDGEFEQFRALAKSVCGISLQPSKKALVSSRLERVVRRHGWGSYAKYLEVLSARADSPERTEFIDCLTTNHTGFFRESDHFAYLQREVFPRVAGNVRIWSSACATGEEPYSISILAQECGVRNIDVLATDISRTALAEAERGQYDESRLAGLIPALRSRHMVPVLGKGSKTFAINSPTRKSVKFQPINLLGPLDHVGKFHVVFCRNVMIYFDRETQEGLVAKLAERIEPKGMLFTGHSESLLRLPSSLEYVQPAIYRKIS